MRWLLGQHDDPLAVAGEHEALYRAIAMRDARRAEQLAAEHVEQSRVTALEHMGVAAGVDAQGD
jgi:DNA-binding FadR family transcriptional regulator